MKIHCYILLLFLLPCFSAWSQKKDHKSVSNDPSAEISALLAKHGCSSCHHSVRRMVGPPFADIAKKNYLSETILDKIANPQPSNWPGYPPMPALIIPNDDAVKIADWINSVTVNSGTEAAKLR
jgi:cytochrome c